MHNNAPKTIILASNSPRRRELLQGVGLACQANPSHIDESRKGAESPVALAARLAAFKAQAVAAQYTDVTIIAADTVVALDDDILGKPSTAGEAKLMLMRLRDRWHHVHSGLAVLRTDTGRSIIQVASTAVLMRAYTAREIEWYVSTGDPMDKAGAYAIQYAGFDPVGHIDGCYANVMGLPLCHLYRVLTAWGVHVATTPLDSCPYAIRDRGCRWYGDIVAQPQDEWERPFDAPRPAP